MTTKIQFSSSLSLANEFAVKLLSGFLNLRIDYGIDDCPLVEVAHTTRYFTTERMANLRVVLSSSRLSRLEVSDFQKDADSLWPDSEIRHVAVFIQDDRGTRAETLIAHFDVHRDYLDGDEYEGWTRWNIKNVRVLVGKTWVELHREYIDHRTDKEPIWGERVQ